MQISRPSTLAWVSAAGMLLSIALGPLLGEYGAFRYLNIGVAVGGLGLWLGDPQRLAAPLGTRAWTGLLVASLLWFEASALTHYAAFSVDEADFGIFDWMLESTARGDFGYSPIHDVHHFGVHSTFLLLLLVPLHALAPSPLWLVILGPLVLWLALFPLRRLVRHAVGDHGGFLVVASLAWLANAYTGRLVNSAFRIESLIPLWSFWFLVGWIEKRRWLWVASVVALFLTKEDSTLFLASFGLFAVVAEKGRRAEAAALVIAAGLWLLIYTSLQPVLAGGPPGYGSFWSDFGVTPGSAALGMLRRPGAVLVRMASSGLWGLYAPLLFLPWLSWRAVGGLAPMTVLLGAATFATMHGFLNYYPIPLVAFALFGVLDVMTTRTGARWRATGLLALLLFPLMGFGYVKVLPFSVATLEHVAAVRRAIADAPRVCAQMGLVPYLGYPKHLVVLGDASCADVPDTVTVVGRLHSPPFEAFDTQEAAWRATRKVIDVGPFMIIGPVGSTPKPPETHHD